MYSETIQFWPLVPWSETESSTASKGPFTTGSLGRHLQEEITIAAA